MTDAERLIWRSLRGRDLAGAKFRRQHPIPPNVVDFCCIERNLIIELDGSQHDLEVDAARTHVLQSQGWTILRFWNNDVLTQTDAVIDAIWNVIGERTLTPTPLPTGEGLTSNAHCLPHAQGEGPTSNEPSRFLPLPSGEGWGEGTPK